MNETDAPGQPDERPAAEPEPRLGAVAVGGEQDSAREGEGPLVVGEEEAAPGEEWPPTEAQPRWVGLVTGIGLALALVVTAQVLAAVAEGMAMRPTEPLGIPGDTLDRLGYPFGGLGSSTALYLIVAVVLVTLPPLAGRRTTDRQESVAAITLALSAVISAVIAVGSILFVRFDLNRFSVTKQPAPPFSRIQLLGFVIGALGASAIALVAALLATRMRDTEIENGAP